MEDLLIKLKNTGLTGNEAKIYLELLKKGQLSANEISKNIQIDRTLSYTVLNHLIKKGFVSYINKQNKKIFFAAEPENLLNPIKEKEIFVKDLISKLKKIEKEKSLENEFNVYEGREGLRTFSKELLKSKIFFAFGGTGRLYNELYEMPHLTKELIKKGAKGKIILSDKYNSKILKIKNLEIRFLNLKSEATTTIFDDKVAIHLIKEKPIVIIIKNKFIAESYRNHFKILWENAKKI
jgi:sugar-specific transcriptional regulator TrmB